MITESPDYFEAALIAYSGERLRCNQCGRFIALRDFMKGARCRLVTPDSYLSKETYEITCMEHSK